MLQPVNAFVLLWIVIVPVVLLQTYWATGCRGPGDLGRFARWSAGAWVVATGAVLGYLASGREPAAGETARALALFAAVFAVPFAATVGGVRLLIAAGARADWYGLGVFALGLASVPVSWAVYAVLATSLGLVPDNPAAGR